ncbi:Hypothetical protein FKW44_002060, partial [Caligus rogercresseyi]
HQGPMVVHESSHWGLHGRCEEPGRKSDAGHKTRARGHNSEELTMVHMAGHWL